MVAAESHAQSIRQWRGEKVREDWLVYAALPCGADLPQRAASNLASYDIGDPT